jgi:hypothetical protein
MKNDNTNLFKASLSPWVGLGVRNLKDYALRHPVGRVILLRCLTKKKPVKICDEIEFIMPERPER